MRTRVAFATLGCKVNRADTALIRERLPPEVEVVPFGEPADVVVVNTCTVTATADRQSRQLVHRAHRASPDAAVIVTGCLADRRPEEVVGLDGVVIVADNPAKQTLAAEVARRLGLPGAETASSREPQYRPAEVTRPPLKIQDGCDGRCAYCAVAAARGRPTSLPADEVLRRLVSFGRQGCAEVVLAGIDLGAWGRDFEPPQRLATLLERVVADAPVERVRLSSIEILHLDDDVLGVMRSTPRICHHLHLPLQSGADPVLRRMRRPYDAAAYGERIRAARAALPDVTLGADVIAGFPGERPEDHRRTLALIEELDLSYLHVFPFSPRPQTEAATLPDPVDGREVRKRAAALRDLGDRQWTAWRQRLSGRETTAVISTKMRGARLTGFSDQGVSLTLDGDPSLCGALVRVRLDRLTEDGMEASLLERLFGAADLQ